MNAIQRASILGIVLGLAACGSTRQKNDARQSDAPASSSVEPETLAVRRVVRAPEHDRLEALAGQWRVEGSFYPRPNTKARGVAGEFTAEWDEGTATLTGTFAGELWDKPFHFVSSFSYDSLLGCWVESWCSKEGEVVRPLAHGYEEEAGRIVTTRYESGRPVRDEILIDSDVMTRRLWRTNSKGVEFMKMEMVFERVDGGR